MPRRCFGEILADLARYNPNGIAITYGEEKISWKELNDRVNRFANALSDLGIKKGDNVVIMFHDCPEFVESNYALQKIGAVPVPMNFRFMAREIEYQTNSSDAVMFIFEDPFLEAVEKARPNLKKVKDYICFARVGRTPKGMLDCEELIEKYLPTEPPSVTTGKDVATISYTGGTTGMPKGVVLTYDNFWSLTEQFFGGSLLTDIITAPNIKLGPVIDRLLPIPGLGGIVDRLIRSLFIRQLAEELIPRLVPLTFGTPIGPLLNRLTGGLSFYMHMPLFHMANYQILMLGPMAGLIAILLRTGISFDPKEVLETVERERPMTILLVPTQWKKVLGYPDIDKYDTSSILISMMGSGITPAERKKEIFEKFPNSIATVDVFGQTEMTPDCIFKVDSGVDTLKDRSVGKPIRGVETRILNEEGEEIKNPGEIGEIVYRGPTVMKEYYKDEDKTREAFTKDGWFYSGDLGYFDEDGDYFIVDRKKECINTGGEKVYPHEIEEILETNPKVRYACIIGVPDPTWGQAVRAVIELRKGESATEEEIIDFCRDKMTGFKRPKSVVFADSLPLTPVEKVLRRKVVEKYGKL